MGLTGSSSAEAFDEELMPSSIHERTCPRSSSKKASVGPFYCGKKLLAFFLSRQCFPTNLRFSMDQLHAAPLRFSYNACLLLPLQTEEATSPPNLIALLLHGRHAHVQAASPCRGTRQSRRPPLFGWFGIRCYPYQATAGFVFFHIPWSLRREGS